MRVLGLIIGMMRLAIVIVMTVVGAMVVKVMIIETMTMVMAS